MNNITKNDLLRDIFRKAVDSSANLAKEPSADDMSHPVNDDELLIRWSLDELDKTEHKQIVAHLAECPYCRRELAAMIKAGALTLPEPADAGQENALVQSTVPLESCYTKPTSRRNLQITLAALAASLLVAAIWGLSQQATENGSVVAMAQRDLKNGRPSEAFGRMEQYLDTNEKLDADTRSEANRLLEESGYQLASKAFSDGDDNTERVSRLLDIEDRVARRAGSSARLLNLRLQSKRGDKHERSLSAQGSLLAYGVDEKGNRKQEYSGIKSFMDPIPVPSEAEKQLKQDFTAAVKSHPDSLDLRLNFGQLLLEQGSFDQAAEQFETAVQLDPKSTLAETGLGLALFRQGTDKSINQALAHFRRAVELLPEDPVAKENLAICLARLITVQQ